MTDYRFPASESAARANASGAEQVIELILSPVGDRRDRDGGDPYAARASILERLVGEGRRRREGLRRLELAWLGRPNRAPMMLLTVQTSMADTDHDDDSRRNLVADVTAALEDHSPVAWRPAGKRLARARAAVAPTRIARLHLATPDDAGLEIYPLRSATLERALARVRVPVLATVQVLVMPRRTVRARAVGSDPQARLGAVGARGDRGRPTPGTQDPAERWQYLVRVEVAAQGDLPRDVLAAIASDVRGAGRQSVGIILSGRAASVDAEWRLVDRTSDRDEVNARDADPARNGGPARNGDRWPADTVSLNLREAACLLALPSGDDPEAPAAERLARVPARLPRRGLVIGSVAGASRPVAIPPEDFLRHLFVIGATGSGKSTGLLGLIDQVARDRDRPALFVLDPHGSLATRVMGSLPVSERERVVLFDPADPIAPMTWNPLLARDEPDQTAIVDAFVSWAWEMWDPERTMHAGMGPIAEQALRAVLLTVMAKPGSTLVDAYDLLADDSLVGRYLPFLSDEPTRRYWAMRRQLADKDKSDVAQYLTSKLAPFASDRALRAVLSDSRSTFDLREAIVAGRIVIIAVRKSEVGSQATEMLLRLIKRFLWREIAARGADVPGQRRVVVVIDEFTNYASELDEVLLQEARKFGTSLVLATQNLGQARTSLVESVAANAASMVAYRVGMPDSAAVAAMLGDPTIAFELTRQPNFRAVARVAVAGEPQPPVLIDSPRPVRGFTPERADEVRARSRAKYGVRRQQAKPDPAGEDSPSGAASVGRPTDTPTAAREASPAAAPAPIGDESAMRDALWRVGMRAAVDADGDLRIEHPSGTFYASVREGTLRLWVTLRVQARLARLAQLELVSRINAGIPLLRAVLVPGTGTRPGAGSLVLEWSLPGDVPYPDAVVASAVDRFVRAALAALELDTDDVLR